MKTATLLILFSLFTSISAFAQIITAPGALRTEITQYPDATPEDQDQLFYFETIGNAQLSMTPMGGASYTFQWYKFNAATQEFDLLLQTDNGMTSSLTISEANGYRVTVDDGNSIAQNYYCWAFQLDQADLDIQFSGDNQCKELTIEVANGLTYYNHKGDNAAIVADHAAQYSWSSDPSGPINSLTDRSNTIEAPYPDTEYTVNLTNSAFGSLTITKEYTAQAVNAEYEAIIKSAADNEGQVNGTTGSAPMRVTFKPKTKSNTEYYVWNYDYDFGDNYFSQDSVETHTYQDIGSFDATLSIKHPVSGCTDTHTKTFEITDFTVLIPDAFTPFSSPGQNDEFKVHFNSVKTFSMIIYNRWGRKVFQTTKPEQGWDGRIGGRKAEPGVYFYQVDATGYNGETPISKSGPVHLIIMNN